MPTAPTAPAPSEATAPARRRYDAPKYVRQVSRNRWQARRHVGPRKHDVANLGLYPAAHLAERAAKAVAAAVRSRADLTPLGVWAIIQQIQTEGVVNANVLPKWVHRVPGGGGYVGRGRAGGRVVEVGPFGNPIAAHVAVAARLTAAR